MEAVSLGSGSGPRVPTVSAYDAFGLAHVQTASGPLLTSYDPVGSGGQFGYYKDYTGYYLLGHRYYDPRAGRFVTRDPIGYKGGINLYGFVGNNPVNESDPSGYHIEPPKDKKERAAYNTAVAFLMKNPTMKKVIRTLQKSKTTYLISANNDDIQDVQFDPSEAHIQPTIEWAPFTAALTQDAGGAITGSQSPALVLGHEFLHAYHYDLNPRYYNDMLVADLSGTPNAGYDNKEEMRTIATERSLAKFFHQTPRYNHSGQSQPVSGPLQRP